MGSIMIFIVATLIAATSCQLLINPLLLQGGGLQPGLGQGLVLPGGGVAVPANTAAAGPGSYKCHDKGVKKIKNSS
ncbi:hypothetical protein Q1695_002091 [Nippostrongylus brasiliensis]|nr:hypothetical protein Q1695_002091 [Nippostrongylus brasiliensis]